MLYSQLRDVIQKRYLKNSQHGLIDVFYLNPEFMIIDTQDLEFLYNHRREIRLMLEDECVCDQITRLFLDETLHFTFEKNQFIQVNHIERLRMTELYQDYIGKICAALDEQHSRRQVLELLQQALYRHFYQLSANLMSHLPPDQSQIVEDQMIFQQPVCSEYDATTQIEILGLDLETLREPVLDLGCGYHGQLVQNLRAAGIEAYGMDREVMAEPHLLMCSWMELKWEPGQWGSVLSHMAFSNHFNFQHQYRWGQPERWAWMYMQILKSLQPGGSFYYAPALPFFEPLIAREHYQILHREFTIPSSGSQDECMQINCCAVRVRRRE